MSESSGSECVCLWRTVNLKRTTQVCCSIPRRKRHSFTRKRVRSRRTSSKHECPPSDQTLLLYQTALSSDFSMHTTPNDSSQCAVLHVTGSARPELRSANCGESNGYICQNVFSNGYLNFTVFPNEVKYDVAVNVCPVHSALLASKEILELDSERDATLGTYWVGVTRHVLPVTAIDKLSGDEGICVSMTTAGSSQAVTFSYGECKEALPFVCSAPSAITDKKTSQSTKSFSTTPTRSTGIADVTLTSREPQRDDSNQTDDTEVVYIFTAVGLVLLFLVVVLGCLCIRRQWKSAVPFETTASSDHPSITKETDLYPACNGAGEYSDIEEVTLTGDYETIPDDGVGMGPFGSRRQDVEMKQYYSSPVDALRLSQRNGSKKLPLRATKSSTSYTYPYDSLIPKTNKQTQEHQYKDIVRSKGKMVLTEETNV